MQITKCRFRLERFGSPERCERLDYAAPAAGISSRCIRLINWGRMRRALGGFINTSFAARRRVSPSSRPLHSPPVDGPPPAFFDPLSDASCRMQPPGIFDLPMGAESRAYIGRTERDSFIDLRAARFGPNPPWDRWQQRAAR